MTVMAEVAELDIQLDMIDLEINDLLRVRHEETRERLERLGYDASRYKPPLQRFELRCSEHVTEDADVESIVRKRASGSRRPPSKER